MTGGLAVDLEGVRLRLGRGGHDVTFSLDRWEVPAGAQVAVCGPSGCGKSTLLHLVCGLRRADAGRLEVLGTDLARLTTWALDDFRGRHIGVIYQSFNLLGPLTAVENVLAGMRFSRRVPHRDRRARAAEMLGRVGLAARAGHYPATLSVGERQRVAIARALANTPDIVVADEPTGALDPVTAASVADLLRGLTTESGATLLLVNHDRDLAAAFPSQLDAAGLVRDGAGVAG